MYANACYSGNDGSDGSNGIAGNGCGSVTICNTIASSVTATGGAASTDSSDSSSGGECGASTMHQWTYYYACTGGGGGAGGNGYAGANIGAGGGGAGAGGKGGNGSSAGVEKAPEYYYQPVDVPKGKSLVYNGGVQTGVLAGTGYSLTGASGKDVGHYEAKAKLDNGCVWTDGTFEDKTIKWAIHSSETEDGEWCHICGEPMRKHEYLTESNTTLNGGNWYVSGILNFENVLTVKGNVALYLADGSVLTAEKGIMIDGKESSLTIYAQSDGNNKGKIIANGSVNAAGIGSGFNGACGNITINGGNVTATGGTNGAGIGSGTRSASEAGTGSDSKGVCGNITINGGTVTATGGTNGAGIGSGDGSLRSTCGNITINGGTVTATGNTDGAGIGSGSLWSICGDITIAGGNVTATGGTNGAGIGSGGGSDRSTCGNITITGGTVTATGGTDGAGIGKGKYGSCGIITISDSVIEAGKTKASATKVSEYKGESYAYIYPCEHEWQCVDMIYHKCDNCYTVENHIDEDSDGICDACNIKICYHEHTTVSYAWNETYTECTATQHCNDCNTDIFTETTTVINLIEDTNGANCQTMGKGHYEATFATLGTAKTASEFDTTCGEHHYVDYICKHCCDELLGDAQNDAIKAINNTADHSEDTILLLLAKTAEDAIQESQSVAEILKIKNDTLAKIEAITAINEAAGKNPSKSVKRIVDGAKEDICSAETVEDVETIRDECIADIEKLTVEAHTHTFSTAWSKNAINHWHNATCGCDEDVVSGFGEHTFDDGVVDGNKTTYTCSICGYDKIVYNGGSTEGEVIGGTTYTGISLTLGSDISINFYMEFSDEARQNGKMTFNIGGRVVTGVTAKYNETEKKYYFQTPLTALEMNETVIATFNYNGVDYIQEYSVADYIEEIVGNENKYGTEAAALAKKIANYGYYAQTYLASIHKNVTIVEPGVNSDKGYDRMIHFGGDFDIKTENAKTALEKYKVTVTGESTNLSFYGSTVYFDSATALNYYVTVKDDTELTAAAVNTKTGKEKDVEIKLYKDNIYIVSVKDITATELADDIEVVINDEITLTGSVFAYCNSVVKAHDVAEPTDKDTFAINAMAAFYEYYQAASDYADNK